MGLLDKFWQTNKNETTISEADDLKLKAFLAGKDELTREDVLSIPQVAADVDLITSTFALIPCKLYKHVINEDDKEGVVEIKDDPRVKLLNVETGDTLNAFQFKKAMCEDYFVGKNGGGYAYIKRTRNNVEGLYYVKSEDVSIQGNLQPIFKDYNVWVNGVEYDKTEFLKLLRNSRDGMVGQNITDEVNNALQSAYQMIKFQQAEDKKQEVVNARALERERREDIGRRNSAEEFEEYSPSEPSESVPETTVFKKVVDTATKEEIDLFAYALSLGSALAKNDRIEKTDIIRPDDFSGDTLRELVRIFLNICDGKNETLFAKMSDYFSRLTINGMPAEDVMLRAVEQADKSPDVKVKSDMYLALLLKVRESIINREEERLMNKRGSASPEEKKKIDAMLGRLADYKLSLRNRIGDL